MVVSTVLGFDMGTVGSVDVFMSSQPRSEEPFERLGSSALRRSWSISQTIKRQAVLNSDAVTSYHKRREIRKEGNRRAFEHANVSEMQELMLHAFNCDFV